MADVDTVVNAQADGKDNVDAGDDVDGDAPEVEEPDDVGEGQDDRQDHQDADPGEIKTAGRFETFIKTWLEWIS